MILLLVQGYNNHTRKGETPEEEEYCLMLINWSISTMGQRHHHNMSMGFSHRSHTTATATYLHSFKHPILRAKGAIPNKKKGKRKLYLVYQPGLKSIFRIIVGPFVSVGNWIGLIHRRWLAHKLGCARVFRSFSAQVLSGGFCPLRVSYLALSERPS